MQPSGKKNSGFDKNPPESRRQYLIENSSSFFKSQKRLEGN